MSLYYPKFIMFPCFVALNLLLLANPLVAKTLHKEKSLYRNIVISEKLQQRCLHFESRKKAIASQACINLKNPDELVFQYTRSIMAGLAYNSNPKRILIIGLGGGSLPNAFAKILPQTEVISVEIDPAVRKLAKQYFFYNESDKIKSVIQDGRVYVKRALKQKQTFDWIILDAFNGEYIPEHLLTVEFLTEVKNLLNKGGIVSANTFTGSQLYHHESTTYQKVFPELRILKSSTKGNRIIFACHCHAIDVKLGFDSELVEQLKVLNVNLPNLVSRISAAVDWDVSAKPLTDQFSPANLLNR
ncbi:MAG: fused MFS/spermidine synthase [Enterobacterales bacterium]|nr:fused MFS/spermidine synthase [Enterobacterales bacterium]